MRRRLREYADDKVIMNAVYDYYRGVPVSDNFLGTVEGILGRIDDYNDEEDIMGAIDDELIYDDDQWEVMKHYQRPSEANFNEAIEYLIDDIFAIASKLADGNLEERFNTRPRRLKESRRRLREGAKTTYDLWDTVYGELTRNGEQKGGKYNIGLGFDETKVTTDREGNIVVYGNSEAELDPVFDVADKHSLKTSGIVKSNRMDRFAPFSITVYIPEDIVLGKPSNNLKLPNNKPLPRMKNGMRLDGTKFVK